MHARGTGIDAPHLQFFRGARKSKKEIREALLLDQKKDIDMYVQFEKWSIWNSTELDEKAINDPRPQRLPPKTSKETLFYW